MSESRKHSLTPLAIFLTPIVFGIMTWLPLLSSQPRSLARDSGPLFPVAIPFVAIFVGLSFVRTSRYVLFRWPLCWLTLLTCFLTLSLWMTFWFGDEDLWMGTPMVHFSFLGVALFAGPIIFVIGLVRLRGSGAWTVPANECIHCGYDLAGLDKDTLCPECGKASGEERR